MTYEELREVEISATEDGNLLLVAPDGVGHFVTALHPLPARLVRLSPEAEGAVEAFAKALGVPVPRSAFLEQAHETDGDVVLTEAGEVQVMGVGADG